MGKDLLRELFHFFLMCVEMVIKTTRGLDVWINTCTKDIYSEDATCLNLVVQEVFNYPHVLFQDSVFKLLLWNSECIFLIESIKREVVCS